MDLVCSEMDHQLRAPFLSTFTQQGLQAESQTPAAAAVLSGFLVICIADVFYQTESPGCFCLR